MLSSVSIKTNTCTNKITYVILLVHVLVLIDSHIPGLFAGETGSCYPLPAQDISCLPVYWLCYSHMAAG